MRRYLANLVFLFITAEAMAVSEPVTIVRACLNNSDSLATIDYRSSTDACGSFVEHHLYAKEASGSWTMLKRIFVLANSSVQVKLPNANPDWKFYFETLYACNGSDSLQSLPQSIDIEPPAKNQIDSVSIDLASQKLLVGWTKNTEADVMGYRIYQNSNDINSTLSDTNATSFVYNKHNPKTAIRITLSAFDSCGIFSTISMPHSPMVLVGELNDCDRTITLDWSPYIGWPINTYEILYSINNNPFTIMGSTTSNVGYVTTSFKPGDVVVFYIRAHHETAPISSSSNAVSFTFTPKALPTVNYLSNTSVIGKQQIEIEVYIENTGPSDSLLLWKKIGGEYIQIADQALINGSSTYSFFDKAVNTELSSESYQITTSATCLGITSTSLTSNTIHLSLTEGGEGLNWNSYINYDGGVQEYRVEGSDGSTWNMLGNTTNNTFDVSLDSSFCYRVCAIEGLNQYNNSKVSCSNEVCTRSEPTFFMPNTLNRLSGNNTFRVVGTRIDYERSSFMIFNRWGEIIFETNDIQTGWTVNPGNYEIMLGVYFYVVSIVDEDGNKHQQTGSIRIIQ
ncbi:MAG: hypothetical protein ACI8ZN_002640 [Bacteroidia bacterium]